MKPDCFFASRLHVNIVGTTVRECVDIVRSLRPVVLLKPLIDGFGSATPCEVVVNGHEAAWLQPRPQDLELGLSARIPISIKAHDSDLLWYR